MFNFNTPRAKRSLRHVVGAQSTFAGLNRIELNSAKVDWVLRSASLGAHVCTRERKRPCATWMNAHECQQQACLGPVSMSACESVCTLWPCPGPSEFTSGEGNVPMYARACVCACVRTRVPAPTALSCAQKASRLPSLGSASKPGFPVNLQPLKLVWKWRCSVKRKGGWWEEMRVPVSAILFLSERIKWFFLHNFWCRG